MVEDDNAIEYHQYKCENSGFIDQNQPLPLNQTLMCMSETNNIEFAKSEVSGDRRPAAPPLSLSFPLPAPRIFVLGLCVLSLAFGLPATALAGGQGRYTRDDGFAFYDIWWMEQRADQDTALMLHFNVPEPPEWAEPGERLLAKEREKEAEEEDEFDELLGDMGGDEEDTADSDPMNKGLEREEKRLRHRDGRPLGEEAPPEMIYDYSPSALDLSVPEGLRKVEKGRFGKALEFTGERGLEVELGEQGQRFSMDAWIKPARIPSEPMCILASPYSDDQGGRLLLDPDGHLRFEWANQNRRGNKDIGHGEVMTLRSDRPIEAGEWTHVSAYTFRSIHIEIAYRRSDFYEMRIGINGRNAAFKDFSNGKLKGGSPEFINPGKFYIGMNPEGEQVFEGLMDDVRVTGPRRYNERVELPFRSDAGEDSDEFGPPDSERDTRIFHASFNTPDDGLFPEETDGIEWDLGEHADYEDMQAPGVTDNALLIDPALGFPRVPIRGLSMEEGTFEFWFQPVNWDNHTNYAKKSSFLNKHAVNVIRFMGRHKDTEKIEQFMEVRMNPVTIHGDADWIHPGQWSHFIFSWSPDDVHEESGWGNKKGDPLGSFRAVRFGSTVWRVQLRRDTSLMSKVEPLYLEIGIERDMKAYQGQRPAIMVDEVIGHDVAFSQEQKEKAPLRWLEEMPDPGLFRGTQRYVGEPASKQK